jgi:hypothetical protein
MSCASSFSVWRGYEELAIDLDHRARRAKIGVELGLARIGLRAKQANKCLADRNAINVLHASNRARATQARLKLKLDFHPGAIGLRLSSIG